MKTNGLASAEAAARAVAAKAAASRLEPHSRRLEELERRIETMERSVLASQRRVLESQEHLLRRVNELGATLAALHRETSALSARVAVLSRASSSGNGPVPGDARALSADGSRNPGVVGPVDYDALVQRVRSLIESTVPPGEQVSVVTRGDAMLLELDRRTGRHFPADAEGSWAGFHPKDSEAAIEHLERLRTLGVAYFVLPHSSYWWLEYYDAFARYLEGRYQLAAHREDTARIYALSEAGAGTRGLA